MPSARTQPLGILEERRRKLDAEIAAKKERLAVQIGTPFVNRFGDTINQKHVTLLVDALDKIGIEDALRRLG